MLRAALQEHLEDEARREAQKRAAMAAGGLLGGLDAMGMLLKALVDDSDSPSAGKVSDYVCRLSQLLSYYYHCHRHCHHHRLRLCHRHCQSSIVNQQSAIVIIIIIVHPHL